MNDYLELVIKILSVIILVSLNILIVSNGKGLDCEKCYVNFHNQKNGVDTYFNISMKEIYNSLINNRCVVIYSEQNGYTKN